jgi:hypothetical protein
MTAGCTVSRRKLIQYLVRQHALAQLRLLGQSSEAYTRLRKTVARAFYWDWDIWDNPGPQAVISFGFVVPLVESSTVLHASFQNASIASRSTSRMRP